MKGLFIITRDESKRKWNFLFAKPNVISSLLILLLVLASAPFVSSANGGDQRVVEGTYLINLSRAPFTPRVGVKTSFLASFVDIQKNKLISEDLVVTIRIAQLDGATKKEFVYEKDNILIHGGVFEFPYTFITTGLHEVFFDFAFTSRPEKVYEAPDFLIDIQPKAKELLPQISLILFAVGVTTGALITWIFTVRKKIKNV